MNDKLTLIMVSGYKRSGKDYVSEVMLQLTEESQVLSFAEPLKDIMAITLGVSKDTLENLKNVGVAVGTHDNYGHVDEIATNARAILQRFGTEAMKKHFGDSVWSDLLVSKMPEYGTVIISDWRFKVEVDTLRRYGKVHTVRVHDHTLVAGDHASEHELDDYDFEYHIDNTAKDASVLEAIEYVTHSIQKQR